MSLQNTKALIEKAKKLAGTILKKQNIAVIHHYDADGITSGAIMVKALQRARKNVKFLGIKQLYSTTIDEISSLGDFFVFVDFGSSHIKELTSSFGSAFAVIDHHQPKYNATDNFLNCWHFGINGSSEASGSTLTYLVARNIADISDMSALAVVGSVGDIQDSTGRLLGINRTVLEEAVAKGFIELKRDLRLYGRFTRPLAQFLMYSTDPVIPFITGDEKNSKLFLLNRGFELKRNERWLSYEHLSYTEKKRFATELAIYMSSINVPEWKIARLIGEVYTLLNEPFGPLRDAKEYATLLNACGRNDSSEIGLEVCLGDRDYAYSKALSLLAEHRKRLREGIQLMIEEGVEEHESFYYFNAGSRIKDSLIGVIAGMLYSSNAISQEKPVIALAVQDDGFIKVSARATRDLVRKGLDLAKALRDCCLEISDGAEGGGHDIAAGARIPEHSVNRFLELLNIKIREQLKAK